MQGEELWSNEVVAALEVRWDDDGEVAVVLDQLGRAPFAGGLVVALVPDLEPAVSGRVVVGDGGVDLLHEDGTGSFVAGVDRFGMCSICPYAKIERECAAGVHRADASDALFATSTFTILDRHGEICWGDSYHKPYRGWLLV